MGTDIATGLGVAVTVALGIVLALSFTRAAWSTTEFRVRAGLGLLAAVLLLGHAVVARSALTGGLAAAADPPLLDGFVRHRAVPLDLLFTEISAVGGTLGMTVLATVTAVAAWAAHHRRAALVMAAAALGAALLVVVAKNLYGRARPPLDLQLTPESSLSLPSGHALGSIVVIGMLAVLAGSRLRSAAARVLVAVVAAVAVGLIGVSRLYLGVHWPSDVLAGWLLGGAWLVACTAVARPLLRADPPPVPDARSEPSRMVR